jgi:hypothetical protein
MKFTYRSGQRPLDGYTIKRGVGQGGFGEVYFAVSDGGKEVALKLLRGHSDAELRGISHCLNLKHPNLVHLYDLRDDDRGDRWVVMEYVFGESLAQVINRHPSGLPLDLVREWFAALARGVGYLHDQGVVHRDLKPANIFVEHGQLKIGDYGLSRRMSSSQGGELTRGVGTPHYMAPEIKNGNYTRTIDIYACGVILFEMLTGHPPFDGETPGEVLMKQQLDNPDLSKVQPAFVPVLEKALDKNPVKRFATMTEFARAVEEAAVRAGAVPTRSAPPQAPQPAAAAPANPVPQPRPVAMPVNRSESAERPKFVSGPLPQAWRERLTELCGSFALAPVVALLCTAPWAIFPSNAAWSTLGRVMLLATVLSWAVLLVGRSPRRDDRNTWGRRFHLLLAGLGVGALAFWLDGWAPARSGSLETRFTPDTISTGIRYTFYFGLATAAIRWWRLTDRQRRERFRLFPLFAAGFWGAALLFLWPWESASGALGVAPLVIAAVAVQVASPWAGAPSPVGRLGTLPRAPRMRHRYA